MLEKRRSSPSVTFSARAVQGGTAHRRQPRRANVAGDPRGQSPLATLAGNRGGHRAWKRRRHGRPALAPSPIPLQGPAPFHRNHRPPETSVDFGPRIRHTLGPAGFQRSVNVPSGPSGPATVRSARTTPLRPGKATVPETCKSLVHGGERRAASTELYSPAFAPKGAQRAPAKTVSGNYK
jgi:hypothetical protein